MICNTSDKNQQMNLFLANTSLKRPVLTSWVRRPEDTSEDWEQKTPSYW